MRNQQFDNQQFNADNYIRASQKLFKYTTIDYPLEVLMNYCKNVIYRNELTWDDAKQSSLIESILINIPINRIYINMIGEKLNVVDGSQRIATLNRFVKNELVLCNLEMLPILNLATFGDLLPSRQRRFMRNTIQVTELAEEIPKNLQDNLYNRINN